VAVRYPGTIVRDECSCGSGQGYAHCCGPYLLGLKHAPNAESLMRSRYTAYARSQRAYLEATWHPSTRPPSLALAANPRWLKLEVVQSWAKGVHATVEFKAYHRLGQGVGILHETSRFVAENGRWYYLDGTLHQES